MSEIPNWVWPILTLISGAAGSWVAVKVAVARLEVHVSDLLLVVKLHTRQIGQHNEDLLIHDIELQSALSKLDLPRARRQQLREREP